MIQFRTVDIDAIFGPDDYADWLRERAQEQAAERWAEDDEGDDEEGERP